MKKCIVCGKEIPDGAEFCAGCGAKQENVITQGSPASDGKAIGALVCGILSIVFAGWVGLILGIVALVLSRGMETNGKVKAGRICAIIGIVFSVLAVAGIVMLGAMFS